jgi:hypothetical protein
MDGFAAYFEGLNGPQTGNAGRGLLLEMLMIVLSTLLSGGDDCTDMVEFGRAEQEFLRGFLRLEHRAPSHDTFNRLFCLLDPEQFCHCFRRFLASFAEVCQDVVAIDGKVPAQLRAITAQRFVHPTHSREPMAYNSYGTLYSPSPTRLNAAQ